MEILNSALHEKEIAGLGENALFTSNNSYIARAEGEGGEEDVLSEEIWVYEEEVEAEGEEEVVLMEIQKAKEGAGKVVLEEVEILVDGDKEVEQEDGKNNDVHTYFQDIHFSDTSPITKSETAIKNLEQKYSSNVCSYSSSSDKSHDDQETNSMSTSHDLEIELSVDSAKKISFCISADQFPPYKIDGDRIVDYSHVIVDILNKAYDDEGRHKA